MSAPGTVELRPRRWLVWALVPISCLLAAGVALARTAHRDGEMGAAPAWVIGTACAALLVLCLVGGARLPRTRYLVSATEVRLLSGRRTRVELRYADLSRVQPYVNGLRRPGLPRTWTHAVLLTGTTPAGRTRTLSVGSNVLPTLAPLWDALTPVVAARPELLPDDAARALFAEYAAAATTPGPPYR